ncbi:MAG: arylformamidase [Acidobacteriota bacterium]|jgi:arylformamidase|nr:arylformamidase [Acidobacteriota bacterium]
MRIYDVSVPISAATPTYPGDPGVEIRQWAAIANGDSANISLLHFGAHTATHVDAPAHFIEGASKVDAMPLDALVGTARVIHIPDDVDAITASHLSAQSIEGATRVLFKTRNSAFWPETARGFRQDFTYIAPDAAHALTSSGVRLVGIDYLSVENFKSERHETHEILLLNGVVIVEGLDLSEVAAGDYELICLPLKIAGGTGDGAPARTILRTLEPK